MSAEERGRSSYLDLLITTLAEHEKTLDSLVNKLEKIAENLKTLEPDEDDITDFNDKVQQTLQRLPKGYNYRVPKVVHKAFVEITWTEPHEGETDGT